MIDGTKALEANEIITEICKYMESCYHMTNEYPEEVRVGSLEFMTLWNSCFNNQYSGSLEKPQPPKYHSGSVRGHVSGSTVGILSYGSMSGSTKGDSYQYDFDDPEFRAAQKAYARRKIKFDEEKAESLKLGEMIMRGPKGPFKLRRIDD